MESLRPKTLRRLLAASGTAALLTCCPAKAAEPQPGLWEMHKTIESGGTSTARQTWTRCITAERASHLAETATHEATVGPATCKSADLRKTDTGMTWTTQCPPLPFRMTASYAGDTPQHYVWTFRRELVLNGQVFATSTITIEGRRIGECAK